MNWSNVPDRAWFATLAVGCFGLVLLGMDLQAMYRLAPCPLCIFQRVLYLSIGALGALGFVWPCVRLLWLALIGGLAGLGFGVAAYQSWMQAFPALATECSYSDPNLIEQLVDWLGMQAPSWFLATGFCTSREWEMFDLSMANWSALVFAGIIAYVGLLAKRHA